MERILPLKRRFQGRLQGLPDTSSAEASRAPRTRLNPTHFLAAIAVLTLSAGWGRPPTRGGAAASPPEPARERGETDERDAAPAARVDVSGFDCGFPAEAEVDRDIEIRCAAPPDVEIAKAVLRFRLSARSSYFARVMVAASDWSWRGTIPAHLVSGRSLHVYVEAANRKRQPVVRWSTKESPHVVMVRGGGPDAADAVSDSDDSAEEENPLEARSDEPPPYRRRRFWVGLGVGDGLGWSLETGPNAARANPAPSIDLSLGPEVGYHLSPRIAVALAGRHQWIQQPTRGSAEATSAHLGLLRLVAFTGTGRHRLYAAATGGAGSGFRLVVSENASSGTARSTVRGGPFVGGAAVGYVGDLDRSRLSFTVDTAGLVGFPDKAILLDVRLGMAAYF